MTPMCSHPVPKTDQDVVSLRAAETGGTFRIESLVGSGCDRLREIGFCESMEVRKLSGGRNLVCTVCGTRLAVSRDLAENVMVKPVVANGRNCDGDVSGA